MKWIAVAGILSFLLGCGDAGQSRKADSPQANTAGAPQPTAGADEELVTDFKSPELAGLAVRDHTGGVEIVTAPTARGTTPPPMGSNDLLWTLAPGAIFTSVNGTSVRDAKHFRDLMNAIKPGTEISLGQTLFLEDAGNGMVSIRTAPPEGQ
jgi:hypothetical protein